jgi:hypothetical protein
MLIALKMLAVYQSSFPKQKGWKAILSDANESAVHQLEEWKTKLEIKKELLEEHKEKTKRRSQNPQQEDKCPYLRCESKMLGSLLGPYWDLSYEIYFTMYHLYLLHKERLYILSGQYTIIPLWKLYVKQLP